MVVDGVMKMFSWFKEVWMRLRYSIEEYRVPNGELDLMLEDGLYGERLDNIYYTTTLDKLKPILQSIPIKYMKYRDEERDCDNFAYMYFVAVKNIFPFLPIGVMHCTVPTGKHAMCWIVYWTGKRFDWTMIEPQENKVSMFAGYKPYFKII